MRGFFKIVFATLLAMILFTVIAFFVLIGIVSSAASSEKPTISSKAVLVLDLSTPFKEQFQENPVGSFFSEENTDIPSLYDVVRLLHHAESDSLVKGIYIQCATNPNGFAASEELRKAVMHFKSTGKFVIAHGETITQKGFYVGSVADSIFCNPQGGLDFSGFSSDILFLKGMLDKLEIQPQIFYAGKFKSATEPLRETKMTEANRLQTSVWLGDLYTHFLLTIGASRKKDTADLRTLAVNGSIRTAYDAVKYGLVDGVRYDDQIKSTLSKKLKQEASETINFVSLHEYKKASDYTASGSKRIAVVFASGDIVSGNGGDDMIGSDKFKNLLRKLRFDKDIKGVVLRVNSPGGSALASEVIWREISLLRKEKPVVVSMGDVAASGGYYIACNADQVFANANTITGSIGVFSVVPNFQSFFKNKLGITFDGVKTAPYADMGSSDKPLTEAEKRFFQASVDSIYDTFKSRVAAGRKKDMLYIDSIAQGRVWTGVRAKEIGLVDRIGTLQDAIEAAASLAKVGAKDYRIKEYPEKKTFFQQIMDGYKKSVSSDLLKEELGAEIYQSMRQVKQVKQWVGVPQTRIPFITTTQF
ncbi:MAG: signal peptide peptidase SppA [Sediminibacterium sp.]|nr:signal peptide peptidase SppA [Sediminibacterium sp.]MBX9780904.1 signal peptide peptidase SppA [Chitinophagaceae bacterium]